MEWKTGEGRSWGKEAVQTFVPQRLPAAARFLRAPPSPPPPGMTGELDGLLSTEPNAKAQIGHHRNNQPQHHRSHRATLTSASQANRALTGIPRPHSPPTTQEPHCSITATHHPPSPRETGRHSATEPRRTGRKAATSCRESRYPPALITGPPPPSPIPS